MSDIKRYVDLIYDENDTVEIRYIWPKDVAGGGTAHSIWCLAKELPGLEQEMSRKNRMGWGVYAGVNPRKDFNLRGDANVLLARNLFCDFDNIEPGDGCGRMEFLLWMLDEKNLPNPSMIISSGNGLHCYWRLSTPLTDLEKWATIQKKLIKSLDSDAAIKNPERVMRLPGFFNTKTRPFKECFIVHGGSRDRFS